MPIYESDAYLTSLTATVADIAPDGASLILDDTILYPGGGGQPEDYGTVAGRRVEKHTKMGQGVRHILDDVDEGPLPALGDAVAVELDWERRFDHMQQHTAQHLLTALAEASRGWVTTSFHLGEELCDIELTAEAVTPEELAELEETANRAVREARGVAVEVVSVDEYRSRDDIRTRGLPEDHVGDVRLIAIEGIDLTACGGTHLASTAEIESVKLLGTESMRGGTRLYWVAGRRVRERLGRHETRASQLRSVLGVAEDEFVASASSRLDQLKTAQKRVKHLEGELAVRTAEGLSSGDSTVVEAHYPDSDAGFLRSVANRFSELGGTRVAFLTAGKDGDGYFVVAAGPDARVEVATIGGRVAELVEGRGGGTSQVYQGRAGTLSHREQVLEFLHAAIDEAT